MTQEELVSDENETKSKMWRLERIGSVAEY